MVQARQLFVYTNAESFGWLTGKKSELVRVAENMVRDYFEADGSPGWAMAVDNKGSIIDAKRDLYAQAFSLLGMSCAYKLTNDKKYLEIADRTLVFLDENMACKPAGYINCLPAKDNIRSQDPHMHLLEALMALHDVAPDRGYLQHADGMVQIFKDHLFQDKMGILVEDFAIDWSLLTGDRGRLFEPGHHCEWIWLLKNYSQRTGRDVQQWITPLEQVFSAHGSAQDGILGGMLWSEVRDDGIVLNDTSRLWPHTEAIRSALSLENYAEADRWLDILYNRFLKPGCPGGWREHWDANGNSLVDYLPASSMYHIVGAIAEYETKRPQDD
jgi:mannose/cellobiose epimerase-like protein (N-acyl-D-glucosamine 2-epimerase family)